MVNQPNDNNQFACDMFAHLLAIGADYNFVDKLGTIYNYMSRIKDREVCLKLVNIMEDFELKSIEEINTKSKDSFKELKNGNEIYKCWSGLIKSREFEKVHEFLEYSRSSNIKPNY